ncbi:MAG: glycosyl transferase [Planctomycetota bacterium]
MADFSQDGPITTIHDLDTVKPGELEQRLNSSTKQYPIGLVLPITASDMRAEPFGNIVEQLAKTEFLDTIVVVLNRAESPDDYRQCADLLKPLGDVAHLLWTDGPRGKAMHEELIDYGFNLRVPGKGRAVWTAFGYLLADPKIKAFVLHDCDIVDYHRDVLVRLCLPMAEPSLDYDFCKAYYARCSDRMHGRVVRLLVTPVLKAMISVLGNDDFLVFLQSFRYPLAGEFAVTSSLAKSNRIPSDWGLEVGTLAEVFRNTSPKRCAQIDIGRTYEHKHQPLSLDDATRGLMKMASDILTSIYRTLASRGIVFEPGHFVSLRAAYLRAAQDAIRQYHADAVLNSLIYDRHEEERAIEGFAQLVIEAGNVYQSDPAGAASMPTWSRVITAVPDFPARLREQAAADAAEHQASS